MTALCPECGGAYEVGAWHPFCSLCCAHSWIGRMRVDWTERPGTPAEGSQTAPAPVAPEPRVQGRTSSTERA